MTKPTTWNNAAPGEPVGHSLTQIHQYLDEVETRVSAIEKRIYAPPKVIDETAYYPVADLAEGVVIRTMAATNSPTGWEIADEQMNGLPTTGYWAIDEDGAVTPTNIAVASVKKFANVEIIVRATNEFGSGDGKFDIHFN